MTTDEVLAGLDEAGRLVEERVGPGGAFAGWDGRDVLCHLAAFARLVGALLQGEAEGRRPTTLELYGRDLSADELALVDLDDVNEAIRREYETLSFDEALALWRAMHGQVIAQAARLSDAQLAAPGPAYPATWFRPHLSEVVTALLAHYAGHMGAQH